MKKTREHRENHTTIERLRLAFTVKGKRHFVPRDHVLWQLKREICLFRLIFVVFTLKQ